MYLRNNQLRIFYVHTETFRIIMAATQREDVS